MRIPVTARSAHIALMVLALGLSAAATQAHTDGTKNQHKANAPVSTEEHEFGKQGNPKKVSRTITVDMTDTMHFIPGNIIVKEGETIRFVVANNGKMMHEMVIGTMDELRKHGELMKQHPGMEHDEPYMSHVNPGRKEQMVWQFTKAGEFYYACLVAGHLEAGMVGKITVTKG